MKTIDYNNLVAGIDSILTDSPNLYTVYSLSGVKVMSESDTIDSLPAGLYIVNGKKTVISK